MRFFYRILFIFFLFLSLSSFLCSDTILLKDGTKIEGQILDIAPKGVSVRTTYVDIVLSQERIQEILQDKQDIPPPPDGDTPPKTDFEKAEELYHGGKLLDAAPLYQKLLEVDPNNKEVIQRLQEIEKKIIMKMKTNNLISVNPIAPISEHDIIRQATRRASPPKSSVQSRPTPAPDSPLSANPLLVPSQQGQIPFDANVFSPQIGIQDKTGNQGTPGSGFAVGMPPLIMPSQPTPSQNPSNIQNPPNIQNPSPGIQGMPPFAPFIDKQKQSQPAPESNSPFSGFPPSQDSSPSISQSMEPRAPLILTQDQPPVIETSRSPFFQETSRIESPDQSLPPLAPSISLKAPFAQKQETSSPSFLIADSAQNQQPVSPAPSQIPPQTTPQMTAQQPAVSPSSNTPSVEFRGIWISRFEWPDKNPSICKNKILRYLDNIAANNFNSVVFQIRGQADALYPSPYEPWSPLLGSADPGFDPLKFALEEAHARKLEFHAYMNVYPVWQGVTPPPHTNPEHPYWLFCQSDSNPNFLCVKKSGEYMKPDRTENDNYLFFSPGIPQVSAYVRKIAMDVVNRYDLDGVHFDRIRYPGMDYSYDNVSQERFKGEGNPAGLSWQDWQCDQITRFLNDVYGEIASVKPRVKVSVSGWGIYNKERYPGYSSFSSGYHQFYQDTFLWMRKGVIDALMPMTYWDIKDPKPNYDELAKDFLANSSGRHVYCANWANQDKISKEEISAQVNLTRQLGGLGNIVFSVSGVERRNLFALYERELYPQPATIPDMPWKSNPQKGVIIGKVLRKDTGEPVTDALINISGGQETWLSSSDGFFAVLNLTPGNYQITVTKTGLGQFNSDFLQVQAGQVSKIDIPLGG